MPYPRIYHRPSILPDHLSQKSLPAFQCVTILRPAGQQYHIPVSLMIFHQISVSHTSHRIMLSQMTMGKNRIIRAALVWTGKLAASCRSNTMMLFRPTLCIKQIIPSIFFIEMRSFRPDGMLHKAIPDRYRLSFQFLRLQVQSLHPDLIISEIGSAACPFSGSNIIAGSIILKKQAWINPLCIQHIRVRPWSLRLFCCHQKIPTAPYIGGHQIISAIMIPNRRCIDSLSMRTFSQLQLRWTFQYISDLFPVLEICTAPYRYSRIKGKSGIHQVIPVSHPADGRVRIEPFQYWIFPNLHIIVSSHNPCESAVFRSVPHFSHPAGCILHTGQIFLLQLFVPHFLLRS